MKKNPAKKPSKTTLETLPLPPPEKEVSIQSSLKAGVNSVSAAVSEKMSSSVTPEPEVSAAPASLDVPTVPLNAPLKIEEVDDKTEEPGIEKSDKKLFVLGIVALSFIILGVLVFIFFFANAGKTALVVKEAVQASPQATLQPSLLRSEWSFEVLNGSGVAGSAKKAADKLEALGYKVVSTDNADKSDYTKDQLFVAESMQSKEDLLLEDLKKEFNIASVSGVLKDSTASARLIIGK